MIDPKAERDTQSMATSVVIGSYHAPRTDTGAIMDALAIPPAKIIALTAFRPSRSNVSAGIGDTGPGVRTGSANQVSAGTTRDGLVPEWRAEHVEVEHAVEPGHFAQRISGMVLEHGADLSLVQEESEAIHSLRRMASDGVAILAQTRRPVVLIPSAWGPTGINTMLMVLDGSKRHAHLIRDHAGRVPLLTGSAVLVAGVSSTRCSLLGHLHLGAREAGTEYPRSVRESRTKVALEEARRVADELKGMGAHAWFTSLDNQDAGAIADLVRSARISVLAVAVHASDLDSRRANRFLLTRVLEVLSIPVLLLPSAAD